jgi:hypothetical protein
VRFQTKTLAVSLLQGFLAPNFGNFAKFARMTASRSPTQVFSQARFEKYAIYPLKRILSMKTSIGYKNFKIRRRERRFFHQNRTRQRKNVAPTQRSDVRLEENCATVRPLREGVRETATGEVLRERLRETILDDVPETKIGKQRQQLPLRMRVWRGDALENGLI